MADNLAIIDGNGVDRTVAAKDVASVHVPRHTVVDETNTAVSVATSTLQSSGNTLLGAVNEAAPATDTDNSGLNGRLQRIAQRITSLLALLPAALGQGTMAQSLRVVLPSDQSSIPVAGAGAHGSAISGNPVRMAGRAATSSFAAVVSGGTADFMTTQLGVQIVRPYSIPENDWNYAAPSGGIGSTTTAVTIKNNVASNRNYITWLDVSTDGPLGTATEIAIRDGAGGTVLWRMKIGTAGLPNGRLIQFPSPIKSSSNTLLEVVTLTATTSGLTFVNCGGYAAP